MSIEHISAYISALNLPPEQTQAIQKLLRMAIDSGKTYQQWKGDLETMLLRDIQTSPETYRRAIKQAATRGDLSWHEGADVWIEVGHQPDRGGELRIAFKESPLPGYADFWVPFSAPTGEALGWLRFTYVTSIREKPVFAASEWRSASEPAPAEQERLDLPLAKALKGFAAVSGDEQSNQQAPANQPPATLEQLDRLSFTKAQKVALNQLAEYWLRIAATAKRDVGTSVNPNEMRALELKLMAHYNCAAQLQNLFQTGNLPDYLGFQIGTKNAE